VIIGRTLNLDDRNVTRIVNDDVAEFLDHPSFPVSAPW
jgi:hypothetical protein